MPVRCATTLAALALSAYALACPAQQPERPPQVYGADANPTGSPIGGGAGYQRILDKGDVTVSTPDELLAALPKAQPGQIVYVAPDARLDLSGHKGIRIPDGVTLAGNRGKDASAGPLLFTTKLAQHASLFVAGGKARVTGLRIKGPDVDFPDINYDVTPRSWTMAIMARDPDVEVDNCEISNFHHSGVNANGKRTYVHHCFIHDVHAYPVVVSHFGEDALIEANIIHWVWHTVAGAGDPGTGYEARYNITVRRTPPASWGAGHKSHGFDMHEHLPAARSPQRRLIAGDRILIHHNTMLDNGPALGALIRGAPRDIAEIHHNWFSEKDPALAVGQTGPPCNLWVYENVYGPEKIRLPVAPQTTPRITLKQPPPPTEKPFVLSRSLPLDVDVRVMDGLRLERVSVELDQRTLYSGAHAPRPGDVVLDPSKLEPGLHELVISAEDDRKTAARLSLTLSVEK